MVCRSGQKLPPAPVKAERGVLRVGTIVMAHQVSLKICALDILGEPGAALTDMTLFHIYSGPGPLASHSQSLSGRQSL